MRADIRPLHIGIKEASYSISKAKALDSVSRGETASRYDVTSRDADDTH